MGELFQLRALRRLNEIKGRVNVNADPLPEWVDVDITLAEDSNATKASARTDKAVQFGVGGSIQAVWDFSKAPTAKLMVAREQIQRALAEASAEFVLIKDLAIDMFSSQRGERFEFSLRLALFADAPARPGVSDSSQALKLELEDLGAGSQVEILKVGFSPPDFPSVARPPAEIAFRAEAKDAQGRPLCELLSALKFQLLSPAAERALLDLPREGTTFGLKYDEKNRRFDWEGLQLYVDSNIVLQLAREGIRDLRIGLVFLAGKDAPEAFAHASLRLNLSGRATDRLRIRWRSGFYADEPSVLPLEEDKPAVEAKLRAVECERLPNGRWSPRVARLHLAAGPHGAELSARARVDGVEFDARIKPGAAPGEGTLEAPIGEWIERLGDDWGLAGPCRIEFEIGVTIEAAGPQRSWIVRLSSELLRKPPPPKWIVCIDYGASTTAIWLGQADAFQPGRALRLGDWLFQFDRSRRPLDDDGTLIPSYVGLASDFHLRARHDPHSLGDLRLALPGLDAAAARLESLDYAYDVSVPFPSGALMNRKYEEGERPAFLDKIVYELKRALLKHQAPLPLAAPIVRRIRAGAGVEQTYKVELAELFQDVLAELGRLVALRALARDVKASGDATLRRLAEARVAGEPFLIVITHPYGVDAGLAQTYRRAGERFADGFAPQLAVQGTQHKVILAPEALAAAKVGVDAFSPERDSDEPVNFIAFDIGAGTFDACIVQDSGAEPEWRLLQHFGVALGGSDLDAELAEIAVKLLKRADAGLGEFRKAFALAPRLDEPSSSERRLLAREIHAAKAQLNRALQAGDNYEWRDEALSICVGVQNDREEGAWPVGFRKEPAEERFQIEPQDWSISVEKSNLHFQEIRLRIGSRFFAADPICGRLHQLTKAMGEELPAMALSAAKAARRVVIVTGRGALWPPLYAAIRASAARAGAQMAKSKPSTPSQMKEAVVMGALALATDPAKLAQLERNLFAPLALLFFAAATGQGAAFSHGRAIQRMELAPEANAGPKEIDIRGPFAIASVVPGLLRPEGLEQRLKFFEGMSEAFGFAPYTVISADINLQARSGSSRYEVTAAEADDRLELRFRALKGDAEDYVLTLDRRGSNLR
jgi:hypothetical protein